MRTPIHPSKEDLTLTRALYALSDPSRLAIVHNLANRGWQACGALCQDMAKSTASHHVRVLRGGCFRTISLLQIERQFKPK